MYLFFYLLPFLLLFISSCKQEEDIVDFGYERSVVRQEILPRDCGESIHNIYQIPHSSKIIFSTQQNQQEIYFLDLAKLDEAPQLLFKQPTLSPALQELNVNLQKEEFCFCPIEEYGQWKNYTTLFTYNFKGDTLSRTPIIFPTEGKLFNNLLVNYCLQLSDTSFLIHYSDQVVTDNPNQYAIKSKDRYANKPVFTIYNTKIKIGDNDGSTAHQLNNFRYPSNYLNYYEYSKIVEPILLDSQHILFHFSVNDSVFVYTLNNSVQSLHDSLNYAPKIQAYRMDGLGNYIRPYSEDFNKRELSSIPNLKRYSYYSELSYLPTQGLLVRTLVDNFYNKAEKNPWQSRYTYIFYTKDFQYWGEYTSNKAVYIADAPIATENVSEKCVYLIYDNKIEKMLLPSSNRKANNNITRDIPYSKL